MAEKTLVDAFTELLGSLTDEQRRAMQEALQKGAALIQGIVAAEGARKPERLPSPAQPADIPDMRGRRP
jgi:hypothetical protein